MGPKSFLVEIINYKWLSHFYLIQPFLFFILFSKYTLSVCIPLPYPQATLKQSSPKKTVTPQYTLTVCILISKSNLNNFPNSYKN